MGKAARLRAQRQAEIQRPQDPARVEAPRVPAIPVAETGDGQRSRLVRVAVESPEELQLINQLTTGERRAALLAAVDEKLSQKLDLVRQAVNRGLPE